MQGFVYDFYAFKFPFFFPSYLLFMPYHHPTPYLAPPFPPSPKSHPLKISHWKRITHQMVSHLRTITVSTSDSKT